MTADPDRQRRAEADRQARASLRLEGLDLQDPATDDIMDRWIAGEINGDEAAQAMIQLPLPGPARTRRAERDPPPSGRHIAVTDPANYRCE